MTKAPAPHGPAIDRRSLLLSGGAVGLGAAAAGLSAAPSCAAPVFPSDPFALGVASGDPWPDSVVLWTRLAPQPLALDGSGGMPARKVQVGWEIATDERFRKVVRRGHAFATPELAHSVHVEVRGLRPDREYFYRFRVLDANEHIKFTSYQRGYMRCTLDDSTFRTDFRVLPYVTRPGAPISTRTSFVTENGNPGLQSA
ncbi:hypothetical protein GCM10010191_87860 [Actinomadura vinacea]|uniref:Phospholipase D N-terminal domain-containing protein n=1 Tax=Actinomadura vinacea TaxID=115336 RepID=A0ABN3KF81_9ACTN